MAYGCFNRAPLKTGAVVQDGWVELESHDGETIITPILVNIPDSMTPDCQYTKTTLGQRDPGCVGCKHKETQ